MEYNFKKIGTIIRKERKAAGFRNQESLINYLSDEYGYSIHRNTLSAIENGKTSHYDCELLYILCEIFDCEMGYLLGEYECKTGRDTDIAKATGLNEKSVNVLRSMKFENGANGFSDILSLLINHPNFRRMLSLLADDATGIINAGSFGKTPIMPDRQAIINSELKDTIIGIASSIRKEYKPDKYAMMMYGFLDGLLHDGELSEKQYKEIRAEYDKGNFDYVPKDFHFS